MQPHIPKPRGEDDFNGRRRSTCKCLRTACSVHFSVQEAGGCPLLKPRAKKCSNQMALFTADVLGIACERDLSWRRFFQCRRPVLAHVKPRTENVAAACFVQAGPSLDKLMCRSVLRFHAHS